MSNYIQVCEDYYQVIAILNAPCKLDSKLSMQHSLAAAIQYTHSLRKAMVIRRLCNLKEGLQARLALSKQSSTMHLISISMHGHFLALPFVLAVSRQINLRFVSKNFFLYKLNGVFFIIAYLLLLPTDSWLDSVYVIQFTKISRKKKICFSKIAGR